MCRELTKLHEEVARGTASELAGRFSEPTRGEVTVVVAPGLERGGSLDEAVEAVDDLVDAGASRRAAVDVVARLARVAERVTAPRTRDPIDVVRRPRYPSNPGVARAENEGGVTCTVFS